MCGAILEADPRPSDDDDVQAGTLSCVGCGARFAIRSGIPRFSEDAYSRSFALQWARFATEQLDSVNGTDISRRRFFAETGWKPTWLAGRRMILDVGCGAGRFLEVAAANGAEVVGIDASAAVDAAAQNLAGVPNVHLVQGDVYALPFVDEAFEGVYCIGVIQHTPEPLGAVASLPRVLRRGGRLALTAYERRRWTRWNGKYVLRPLTRRLAPVTLLRAITVLMPILFVLTEILFRLPVAGRFFRFALPVANYVDERRLTLAQRYRWALLDTFDMLAPAYDEPQTEAEVTAALARSDIVSIRRLSRRGLNLIGERRSPG